jgi:tetratricopeptide (TPR) repeat protein
MWNKMGLASRVFSQLFSREIPVPSDNNSNRDAETTSSISDTRLVLFLRKRGPSLVLLLCIVFLVNAVSLWHEFAGREDEFLVLDNERIRSLSLAGLFKLFTSAYHGSFHPLVDLSLALDFRLGGFNPFIYHLQNIAWHLVNVWLVYRIFRRIGNNRTKGWMVALFFGIHPMHAESVAWISGRKDVLYAAGFLFSILCYYRFTLTNNKYLYRLSLVGFVWACLCKPMAMSLPLLLPLLDYVGNRKVSLRGSISEKFPFFFIGLVLAWFTFLAQLEGGRIGSLHNWQEVLFLCRSLVFYIGRTLVPLQLSAFYPFPEIPELRDYVAVMIVLGIILTFTKWIPFSRVTKTGWLFFLICILPVLQLFPAGQALMADRNHYIAGLGLIYIIVEFLWIAWYRYPALRNILPLSALALAIIFSGLQIRRSFVYKNHDNYYGDILGYNPDIYQSNLNYADLLVKRGDSDKAIPYYLKLVKLYPDYEKPFSAAGKIFLQKGAYAISEQMFKKAIERSREPEMIYAHYAHAFYYQQKWDSALHYFKICVKEFPENAEYRVHLAETYHKTGNTESAFHYLYEALNINPEYGEASYQMALLSQEVGRYEDALSWMKASAKQGNAEAKTYLERR